METIVTLFQLLLAPFLIIGTIGKAILGFLRLLGIGLPDKRDRDP